MAKKDTAYQEFLADIKAIAPGIEEILKDDKVSSKMREAVLARAEFSSQMDSLRTERESFAAEVKEAQDRIAGWQKWYGDTSKQFAATADELQKYKDEFGDLDPAAQRKEAAKVGLTPEEFDKKLNDALEQRSTAMVKFADDLTEIKLQHRDRFKEKLDTQELFKLAGEKNLPLDVAYDVYIADKVEAQTKQKHEEALKLAREEGAREALAQHKLPVLNSNPGIVHVLDTKDAHRDSSSRISAAVNAFRSKA